MIITAIEKSQIKINLLRIRKNKEHKKKELPCSHLLNPLPVQHSQFHQPHTPTVKLGRSPELSAKNDAVPSFPIKLMTRASN